MAVTFKEAVQKAGKVRKKNAEISFPLHTILPPGEELISGSMGRNRPESRKNNFLNHLILRTKV